MTPNEKVGPVLLGLLTVVDLYWLPFFFGVQPLRTLQVENWIGRATSPVAQVTKKMEDELDQTVSVYTDGNLRDRKSICGSRLSGKWMLLVSVALLSPYASRAVSSLCHHSASSCQSKPTCSAQPSFSALKKLQVVVKLSFVWESCPALACRTRPLFSANQSILSRTTHEGRVGKHRKYNRQWP